MNELNFEKAESSIQDTKTRKDSRKFYNQKESKLIINTIMFFSLALIMVCGLGLLWSYLAKEQDEVLIFSIFGTTFLIGFITRLVLTITLSNKLFSLKSWASIFLYIFNILLYSVLFGSISMILIKENIPFYEILAVFGIVGVLTIIAGLIGYSLSVKGALVLSRIIAILFGVVVVGTLICSLVLFFVSPEFFYWWSIIYDVLISIIFIGYMIGIFYKIKRLSMLEDFAVLSTNQINNISLYFAIEILSNFMWLLTILFTWRRKN